MNVAPGLLAASRRPRIVAILPAFNEEDVIGSVIRDYVEDGVEVYLIDNCSTDGTAEVAREWLGQGLIHIERFPDDVGGPARARKEYMWGEILRRNELLAAQLGADWYIRADADEFREGPWPGMSHAESIHLVDALGYTAVQSQVLEFRPTDDSFSAGADPRDHLHHYERCDLSNSLWVKAWRQPPAGVHVDIAKTGGHEAGFPGRRVFPIHFISRHYPIRTSEHARRKIFTERLNRYPKEERERGWHIHWDELAASGHSFLWDPDDPDLVRYDRAEACARVLAQGSADVLLSAALHGADLVADAPYNERFAAWMGAACQAGSPFAPKGSEIAAHWMRRLAAQALHDEPLDLPSEPLLVRAVLVSFDLSLAHLRAAGRFHDSFILSGVRDRLVPLAERALAEAPAALPADEPAVLPQAVRSAPQPPRNAPCPCGSGLKYKKCHGREQAAA
jgi:SEC-C motif/Glycosyl transferase family 2